MVAVAIDTHVIVLVGQYVGPFLSENAQTNCF
jgi:hypothetical protein